MRKLLTATALTLCALGSMAFAEEPIPGWICDRPVYIGNLYQTETFTYELQTNVYNGTWCAAISGHSPQAPDNCDTQHVEIGCKLTRHIQSLTEEQAHQIAERKATEMGDTSAHHVILFSFDRGKDVTLVSRQPGDCGTEVWGVNMNLMLYKNCRVQAGASLVPSK